MDLSGDELAGVVDMFGGLTRTELDRAIEELAFKRGHETTEEAVSGAIDDALESYHLVAVGVESGDESDTDVEGELPNANEADGEHDDPGTLLVAGPAAFPALLDGAEDLPHIMNVPERTVDRARAVTAARDQLVADAESASSAGDAERAADLVDVSYDLEAWGAIDASDVRDRLDDV